VVDLVFGLESAGKKAVVMKAIVVRANTPHGMGFAEVREPTPTDEQMVIEVSHVSLNHGDINDALSGRIPEHGTLGSDAVGTVIKPACCGMMRRRRQTGAN